ncbi:uncharacterized protein LOC119189659 [Manduca sexta]|uniref:uncharacterized protein LOC119189659 n=1 Tax=Manduca sexta TaxID=7130 RepID=UPI00188E7C54|nr:uncharacterized protein LOC119189659 [Manduca sexta]
MARMKIIAVIIGVLGVVPYALATDQSEIFLPKEEPITSQENDAGQRRVATPEVVLQLKYDRGGLNKIYLAQFRQDAKVWKPSVPARTNLCADLCHAGLGGEACGSSCTQMIPIGLQNALEDTNRTDVLYGQPRVSVCPSLCGNYLDLSVT